MTGWDNQDSVYYHKPGPFKDLILSLANRSSLVSDALQGFREVKCLSNRFKKMTVEELRQKPEQIEELYNSLRNGMQPQSKLALPYTSMAERGQELIDNIAGLYNVNKHKAKYRIIKGHYDDGTLNYHYVFEIAAAPYNDPSIEDGGHFDFIGSINSSPSTDDGHGYFQGGGYVWTDKKRKPRTASSISEILYKCGFDDSLATSKQKAPCVFIANLISPVIDWLGGYGKSRIDLRPFADDIAKATSSVAYQMPSFHGSGGYSRYDKDWLNSFEKRNSIKDYLIELLHERRQEVNVNPDLKRTNRWTQSTVWYRLRPTLLENDVEIKSGSRQYVTGMINDICKEEFGVSREVLGIIASARAVLYFDGRWESVDMDIVEQLAERGTDIIFVEKKGIVELLTSYADEYGIALVNTSGRLTEYGKDLIEGANRSGANVAILTDYDALGIQIAEGARIQIPRIGVDKETLEYFQLPAKDVEEEYKPNDNAIGPVIEWTSTGLERYRYIDAEYLDTKPIEIDSIVAAVGGERFWGYIIHKLKKLFPGGRNYNRVISKPRIESLYPAPVQDFLFYLEDFTSKRISDEWTRIQSSLKNVKGLLKVDDKKEEINKKLETLVAENNGMRVIVSKIIKLMKSGGLPDVKPLDK